MDEIRRAAAIVRTEFDAPYALAGRRITTDGTAIRLHHYPSSAEEYDLTETVVEDVLRPAA